MRVAPLSPKETLRLAKLDEYRILDTPPQPAYDDIVALAAHVCQTPTALVSLVDASRQWFKAKVGLDASETHRSMAFCSHTIEQDEVMVVEDTLRSEQFRHNPLVTGSPYIRFYAGAPLITPDGHALGSLCVIDYQPRQLTEAQIQALTVLSRQVVAQMEMARQARLLQATDEQLERRVRERTAGLATALHRLLNTRSTSLKSNRTANRALQDWLTGLPNRGYFLQRLQQAIALSQRQSSRQYAVLMMDLKDLSSVNDTYGHGVGDQLLQYVAERLQQSVRESDLVARLGGDQFAIMLDDIAKRRQAIAAVKRLQQQFQRPFSYAGRDIAIHVSMGITFSDVGYRQAEAVLEDVAIAMMKAQQQTQPFVPQPAPPRPQGQPSPAPIFIQAPSAGRGLQFVIFDPSMRDHA